MLHICWENLKFGEICQRANLGKITTLLLALRNEMQPAKMVFDQICSLGKFVQMYNFADNFT